MASKKEKRQRLLEKRANFEAKVREDGLKAQAADRERRKREEQAMWDDAHKTHLKRNRFHDKCPNCAKVKAQQAVDKLAKAAAKRKETSDRIDEMIAGGASESQIATAVEDSQKEIDLTRNEDSFLRELTDEEARKMDEESTERIKGVLQEMGALSRKDQISA